jgi:hypothetical protein
MSAGGLGFTRNNAAGLADRVANGCDIGYVRGLVGDIRRSTSPPREHKLEQLASYLCG